VRRPASRSHDVFEFQSFELLVFRDELEPFDHELLDSDLDQFFFDF
jgi:hypothetical protein